MSKREVFDLDKMTMLERLISIRINADERASLNGNYRHNSYITKAELLENGIIQLIIEIQNSIIVEKLFSRQINSNY